MASRTQAIAARREREKEALRQRILDAAREMFRNEEYSQVSLRKIAEQIEYSPTTIYLYFRDKQHLVMELVAEGFELLHARMQRGYSQDPLQTLRQAALEYLRFSLEEPHYYRLMFYLSRQDRHSLPWAEGREKASDTCFRFLLETVSRVRREKHGDLAQDDLMVAHVLWAALHGAAGLALGQMLGHLEARDPMEFFDTVVQTLTRAVSL